MMKLPRKLPYVPANARAVFLILLGAALCSCENQTNMPQASSYRASLTPTERANPRIERVLTSARQLDLTGVSRDINNLTDPPGEQERDCSGFETNVLPTPPRTNFDNTPFEPISSRPSSDRRPIRLWATNYYTPVYHTAEGGVPLKKKNESPIQYQGRTVSLPHRRWCMAAMEGSVSIRMPDGTTKTYNYSGVGSMQTDCTGYFRGKHRATGRVKFMEVDNAWGYGVRNYSLIPYRTIAVDPRVIPYGSVVFIPDAVGKEITLSDGTSFTHDGYFFAGDTGGAIKNNQIDVFTGNNRNPDLDFVRSTSSGTFNAQVVSDPEVVAHLERLHRIRY